VGVRSMQSDMESVRQSGGEQPQSTIINAPPLSSQKEPAPPAPIAPPPSSPVSEPGGNESPHVSSAPVVEKDIPASPEAVEETPKAPSSFSLRTILLIVGIVVAAAVVGYGAYYLVSSLRSEPAVNVLQQSQTQFPVEQQTQESQDTQEPQEPAQPQEQPLVHSSLITNPTASFQIAVASPSLAEFVGGIATTTTPTSAAAGSVSDLSFSDENGALIESSTLLGAFLPQASVAITPLVQRDATAWVYYDKVGGKKLGFIFSLKEEVLSDQAVPIVQSAIEATPADIANLFLSSTTVPASPEFKEGQVENLPVRFLVFDAKKGQVFEYGWLTSGASTYLVLTTSYNQMVDIVTRLTPSVEQ